MYREQIKVLDCTIRDGGLINNHDFDMKFVRGVYKAVAASGVDYIELGYKNSKGMFDEKEYGVWKFCEDDVIKKVIEGQESDIKISTMVDIGRVDMKDVKDAKDSPVDMMRVACYVKDIDKAIAMVNEFDALGYETTINLMAISKNLGSELDEALQQAEEEAKCGTIYMVDSFGSFYQETIEEEIKRAKKWLKTKEVGFHGHNNQQLAFSNTIEAIIHGANYLDATVYGIGRAAGNCTLELLLGFLKNPKYDLRPILELISKQFIPLREQIEWGYIIPFAIAGMMNEHPRASMEFRNGPDKDNYVKFFDTLSKSDL